MRRVVICSGVLGGGTALVFALAALTASLFPHGTVVPNQFGWGGGWSKVDDMGVEVAMPAMEEPAILLEDVDEGKP